MNERLNLVGVLDENMARIIQGNNLGGGVPIGAMMAAKSVSDTLGCAILQSARLKNF